jgi:hypothetical protein
MVEALPQPNTDELLWCSNGLVACVELPPGVRSSSSGELGGDGSSWRRMCGSRGGVEGVAGDAGTASWPATKRPGRREEAGGESVSGSSAPSKMRGVVGGCCAKGSSREALTPLLALIVSGDTAVF